jgi:hypothetical protein
VVYGGDAYDFLDPGAQIFARWLQKKVVIQDSTGVYLLEGSYGPDRQWFAVSGGQTVQGTITVFAEDGVTPIGTGPITLTGGKTYQLVLPPG